MATDDEVIEISAMNLVGIAKCDGGKRDKAFLFKADTDRDSEV